MGRSTSTAKQNVLRDILVFDDIEDEADVMKSAGPRPSAPKSSESKCRDSQNRKVQRDDKRHHHNHGLPSFTKVEKYASSNQNCFNSERRDLKPLKNTFDECLWTEIYSPKCLSELAVHKKKLEAVRNWCEGFVTDSRKSTKILVLKGPTGCGKSTLLRLVAEEMNCDIFDWNLNSGFFQPEGLQKSISSLFDEFLRRSTRFNSLQLGTAIHKRENTNEGSNKSHENISRGKLLLLEDHPALLNSNSNCSSVFRKQFINFLARSQSPTSLCVMPVAAVLILSDCQMSHDGKPQTDLTLQNLLGLELLDQPQLTLIEFNPIAPTYMAKALRQVCRKAAKAGLTHAVKIGESLLPPLSIYGDIRNAINVLQFNCCHYTIASAREEYSLSETRSKSRGASSGRATRDLALGLFHAVGKVLYNKRQCLIDGDSSASHLRAVQLEIKVNQIKDEMATDLPTFASSLHENYVESCECESFLQHVNGCVDALSEIDIMTARGRDSSISSTTGPTLRTISTEDIAFEMLTRGMLKALPYPVKRCGGQKSGDVGSRNFNFPESIRISQAVKVMQENIQKFRSICYSLGPSSSLVIGQGIAAGSEIPTKPSASLSNSQDSIAQHVLPYLTIINMKHIKSDEAMSIQRSRTSASTTMLPTWCNLDNMLRERKSNLAFGDKIRGVSVLHGNHRSLTQLKNDEIEDF